MTRPRLAAAAAVPWAALCLTGCAKTIRAADVEAKIAQNIAGQLQGPKVTVDCPGGQQAEKGAMFTCDVAIAGGRAAADVRLLDDKGSFSFRLRRVAAP